VLEQIGHARHMADNVLTYMEYDGRTPLLTLSHVSLWSSSPLIPSVAPCPSVFVHPGSKDPGPCHEVQSSGSVNPFGPPVLIFSVFLKHPSSIPLSHEDIYPAMAACLNSNETM
jgi:hypothetical protein